MLRLRSTSIAEPKARSWRCCALAALLLLLLSGFGGSGIADLVHAADAVVSADCADDGEGRGHAPLAHCVQCCTLCDCLGQLDAGPANDAERGLRRAAGRAARASDGGDCADRVDRRPPGWASSWSSQAPPFFS